MEILNLKDSVEKDSFFRKLPNIAEQLPREIVLKKVSKEINNHNVNFNIHKLLWINIKYFINTVASSASFLLGVWLSCCPCLDCSVKDGCMAVT
jgi:hypothetical protein